MLISKSALRRPGFPVYVDLLGLSGIFAFSGTFAPVVSGLYQPMIRRFSVPNSLPQHLLGIYPSIWGSRVSPFQREFSSLEGIAFNRIFVTNKRNRCCTVEPLRNRHRTVVSSLSGSETDLGILITPAATNINLL